jgi:hypothetical protein
MNHVPPPPSATNFGAAQCGKDFPSRSCGDP